MIFITVFYFFKNIPVKAQEQIKILPTSYGGNWQNPIAVFSQDVDTDATMADFNQNNSAFPFIIEKAAEGDNIKPEIDNSSPDFIGSIIEEASDLIIDEEVVTDETIVTNSENLTSEPEQNPSNDSQSNEIIQIETNQIEGSLSNIDLKPLIEEQKNTTEEKILELSNFNVADSFSDYKINNFQLRLSLAAKGQKTDTLIIDYFYNDEWYNSAQTNLENEISNNSNGGYFLYAMPTLRHFSDLKNFKVKLTYRTENPLSEESIVYLDSLWLEIGLEEKPEIIPELKEMPKPEEQIKKIKKALQRFLEFSVTEGAIKSTKKLNWYPERFKPDNDESKNDGINLRTAMEMMPGQPQRQKLIFSGACQKEYFVILMYSRPDDYINDPGKFIYNKAFPCQNGSYYYELKDLPENLSEGTYYFLVAEQGKTGPWQPITAIQPIQINVVEK